MRKRALLRAVRSACEMLEDRLLLSGTVYVDANAPGVTQDGVSWETAYRDLQTALGVAQAGDQLHVADGTYKPTTGTQRLATFQMKTGIGLYGGFAGYGAADPDRRDAIATPSILSGDIGTAGVDTDNSCHVVTAQGNAAAILDGFTVTKGYADLHISPGDSYFGAGIYVASGTPTIRQCTIIGNFSSSDGGGMYLASGAVPAITDCIFSANRANSNGGALYIKTTSLVAVTGCVFDGNKGSARGGGVYASTAPVSLSDCVFNGNSGASGGGGLYLTSSMPSEVVRCTFAGNLLGGGVTVSGGTSFSDCIFESNEGGNGGGVAVSGSSTVTFTRCTLRSNTASSGGGIYCNSNSSALMTECTISANDASTWGGGIYAGYHSTLTLVNCIVASNSSGHDGGGMYSSSASPVLVDCALIGNAAARDGGGVFNDWSTTNATNCTLTGNSAGRSGGGICNGNGVSTLVNCIVWRNHAAAGGQLFVMSGEVSASHSDIEGGWIGSGNIDADPLFQRNPSPGADGKWGTADDNQGDLNLSAASPAADAGDNGAVPAGVVTDLAGMPRFADIPTTIDSGAGEAPIVDMGAYEAEAVLSARAGGPYVVIEGQPLTLQGHGASTEPGTLQYAWEWSGDGMFDEATGRSPLFPAEGFSAGSVVEVRLRVTDAGGASTISSATVRIAPAILYVDAGATGAGDGTSWTDAMTDLASALQTAVPGQAIHVAGGTYLPTAGTDVNQAFQLKSGVALYGGYAGVPAPDPDARDWSVHPSVLSGDIGTAGVSSDNSLHVVRGSGVDASAVLDGFTVTGGRATAPIGLDEGGAGMYNFAGSPTVANCLFVGNVASNYGGAIYNNQSSPRFVNCSFSGNTAAKGAAIYNDNSSPAFVNCSVSGNAATGDYGYAGGIYDLGSSAALTNCIVWGNSARIGAQIYEDGSSNTVSVSDVQGGWAGVGNIDSDPLFVRSPSPGADGKWGTSDDDYGDLRLAADSPAADAGDNAALPSGGTTDLSGAVRFQDIPTTTDAGAGTPPIVDMGAYEATAALSAHAGGPYIVLEGQPLALDGHGASDVSGALVYAWEWSGDGQFDEATGANPVFTPEGYAVGTVLNISLKVSDAAGASVIHATTLRIVPAILYVDDTATGAGDGASWADAIGTLQTALGAAVPGQEIHVAGGTYGSVSIPNSASQFQLKNGVALYGGYAGSGAPEPDARDVDKYPSILSGEFGSVYLSHVTHVVDASGVDASVILDGFTITGGSANGSSAAPSGRGGGMYCEGGTPTIRNCTFTANQAAYGGAVFVAHRSPSFVNCTFIENSATSRAGAVYTYFLEGLVLEDCVFIRNTAPSGGAVFNDNAETRVLACGFAGNVPTSGSNGDGTAILNWASTTQIVNCTFVGNATVVDEMWCTTSIVNCTFSGNTPSAYGRTAVHLTGGSSLSNCIIWDRAAPFQAPAPLDQVRYSYCDVQGGAAGDNISIDPLFVRDPNPGADGVWGTVDDDYGDLRPAFFSPVIDAGSNALVPAGVTTDALGRPRFADTPFVPDTGAGTAPIVDMGAYEVGMEASAYAAGPYWVTQGQVITLHGQGTGSVEGPLQYAWEWTGDGKFDDASGTDPVFSAVGLPAGTISVSLQVTDAVGERAVASTTLTIVRGVLYVDAAATGANDGTNWANAYTSVSAALNAAVGGLPGQEIRVADGTYKPTNGSDRTVSFGLKNEVKLMGGYAGVGAADPDARSIALYPSILSGDIGSIGSIYDNSYHVVTGDGTDGTAILDGFTVTGGNANGSMPGNLGGGMYNSAGSPTIRNCAFSGNTAVTGGAIYNTASSPALTNCTFSGNSALSGTGVGMYNGAASSPMLENCTLAENTGSAMFNSLSSPVIRNCIVWSVLGTGITESGGTSTVTYSLVKGGFLGTGNISVDPQLVRNPSGTDYGDLRLRLTSPAIDAGNNADVSVGVTADLAGNGRFADIPAIADSGVGIGPIVDMGAFEAVWHPVVYVDGNATGLEDGGGWSTAYRSLAAALALAISGQELRVADGTYKPTPGTDRAASFQLKSGVAIYGGYAGYGAADPDTRNVSGNPSILSGDIGVTGTSSNYDNSYHVVTASGTDGTAVLDGFTITAGNANGSNPSFGGGLFNSAGSPNILNCSFYGNSASNGGGVYNTAAAPVLLNCAFAGNVGGGVYNTSASTPTLVNCTVAETTGVGIYSVSASPVIRNCVVWSPSGPAIVTGGATAAVSYSIVKGGYLGDGNLDADPQYVRNPSGTDFGDLRLRLTSPAIDAAANEDVPSGVMVDLAGNARFSDVPATADSGVGTAPIVDMGAFEAVWHPVVYVDGNATGLEDGGSWSTAYRSLAAALAMAISGQELRVADGTYKPTPVTNRTASFQLKSGVAIYGGYAGYGTADPDERDVTANPTILSGAGSYHVVVGSGTDNTAVLDGFTITLGRADGTGPNNAGAGMYNAAGSPTVRNCTFTGNFASGNGVGAGMYNTDSSSPVLINCIFTGNTVASINGAAVGHGGGMYNTGSSSPTLTHCTFSGNTAYLGAGMYNTTASVPTLIACVFVGNVASVWGGGMYNDAGSDSSVTNCVFIGNEANESGGGMYNDASSPLLTNCTFIANYSTSGCIYNASSSSPEITNCIVWGAGNTIPIENSSSTPVVSYCDVMGGYDGAGNIGAEPQFVRSPWAGPDGHFGTADDDYGDLHLRSGSAAVDVGDNAAVAGVPADAGGNVRIQNGAVDLGAFEGVVVVSVPKTLYVDGSATGESSGGSWADAFGTLQSALSVAVDGDTIRIAHGTYTPTTTTDRTISFALRNAVAVFGGYAGYGAADPDVRDTALYATVLSGDIKTIGSSSDNSYHVVTAVGVGPLTILDGVTVTGGNADGTNSDRDTGGGLFEVGSSPTLTNCVFSANTSASSGGGMKDAYGSPLLTNCTFTGNLATGGGGGGMYVSRSNATLRNCAFIGNKTTYASGKGGGVGAGDASTKLTGCMFSGNTAVSGGAGMSNLSSIAMLTNCTFSGNKVTGTYGSGGAFENLNYANAILINCRFAGNSVTGTKSSGGGMDSNGSDAMLVDCTFVGNSSAADGGGLVKSGGNATLTNCAFVGNKSVSVYGGGLFVNSETTLVSCIVWDNTSADGTQIRGTATVSSSDVQGGFAGTGNIDADPLFVRNPSAGADGNWGTADDDYGDLHLQAGSPCIDAGSNAGVPVGITTDLDGNPRIIDMPGVHDPGAIVDMGVYEAGLPPVTIGGTAGDDRLYVRLSADQSELQVWEGDAAVGEPGASYALAGPYGIVIDLGAGDDRLVVDVSNGMPTIPLSVLGGDGLDTLVITGSAQLNALDVQAGQVTLNGGAVVKSDAEQVLLDADAGSAIGIAALTLGGPLGLVAGKNLTLRAGSIDMTGAGSLDLGGGSLILDYAGASPAQQVRQWVQNGRLGVTPALKTSGGAGGEAVLGFVDNQLLHLDAFAGQALGGIFSQVLIRTTVAGDTNLDGAVTQADAANVLANMGQTSAQWFLGDLNDDGVVSADDLGEVMAHLGDGVGGVAAAMVAAPVPAKATMAEAPVATKAAVSTETTGDADAAAAARARAQARAQAARKAKVRKMQRLQLRRRALLAQLAKKRA